MTEAGALNTIGWAVKQLHNGRRVRRRGWSGKDMYLCWAAVKVYPLDSTPGGEYIQAQRGVYVWTVDKLFVAWLCSQTDLNATDWEIAE